MHLSGIVSQAHATAGIIYFKNKTNQIAYVWINGSYQGGAPAGKTAYTVVEGFVTPDSGFNEEGELETEHSHGGWQPTGTLTIRAYGPMRDDGTFFLWEGSAPDNGASMDIWIGGGEALGPEDREFAVKILKTGPSANYKAALEIGKAETDEIGGGGTSSGAKLAAMMGGVEEGAEGETFVNSTGMKMIWVEPGAVQGRAWEWVDGDFRDGGVRKIMIDQGYFLGATEVTQRQYSAISEGDPLSRFLGADRPVESVTWEEAVAFCQRLTARERAAGTLPKGFAYALPSEAQWEYACRAGTTGDYAGDLDAMAWYYRNKTHPVATKQANRWGFHDMHGNVWEWCGYRLNDGRVLRGGSWKDGAKECRSGCRFLYVPSDRYVCEGFRAALVLSK